MIIKTDETAPGRGDEGAGIHVRLEPEGREVMLPKAGVVARMLQGFGLRPTDCLVIRRLSETEAELLTHDLRTRPGDRLIIRKVASSG